MNKGTKFLYTFGISPYDIRKMSDNEFDIWLKDWYLDPDERGVFQCPACNHIFRYNNSDGPDEYGVTNWEPTCPKCGKTFYTNDCYWR